MFQPFEHRNFSDLFQYYLYLHFNVFYQPTNLSQLLGYDLHEMTTPFKAQKPFHFNTTLPNLSGFRTSIGQAFCNLHTGLHLFYCISHSISKDKWNFLIVYGVILCIHWATLSCKNMWMILVYETYTHLIYHPTWASCSENYYSITWWDTNLIHDFFDSFPALHCNLDHIVKDICDVIKALRFLAWCV